MGKEIAEKLLAHFFIIVKARPLIPSIASRIYGRWDIFFW